MLYSANNIQHRFQGGVSNDRHSSVQFVLSQSDRDAGGLTMSQNNYIQVTDENSQKQVPVYLQWSLTQSGLDSIENESHAAKQQMTQQFQSATSYNPTVKSEDYQSQFNSVQLANNVSSHLHNRPGEHQKPIIVNSMGPMAADFTPDSTIHQIPSAEKQNQYDNILSSPSLHKSLENSLDKDESELRDISSVTKKDEDMSSLL